MPPRLNLKVQWVLLRKTWKRKKFLEIIKNAYLKLKFSLNLPANLAILYLLFTTSVIPFHCILLYVFAMLKVNMYDYNYLLFLLVLLQFLYIFLPISKFLAAALLKSSSVWHVLKCEFNVAASFSLMTTCVVTTIFMHEYMQYATCNNSHYKKSSLTYKCHNGRISWMIVMMVLLSPWLKI